MDKKNYKRIDWSERKAIEECVSFGDTNGNVFSSTLSPDGEWIEGTRTQNQIQE